MRSGRQRFEEVPLKVKSNMGAGASIDASSMLTKEEAMTLAGEQWDEAKWDAAEKDESGKIKAELLLAAVAPAAEASNIEAPPEETAQEATTEPQADAAATEDSVPSKPVEAAIEEAPTDLPTEGVSMPAEEVAPAEESRSSTIDEMQHHAKSLASSEKYVFGDPSSRNVDVKGLEHLTAGGFSTGSLVTQMETPEELHGAEMVFFKLAQKLEVDGDSKSSGFGSRYRPVTVNYYKMFKQVDMDCDKEIERDEFEKTLRRILGIKRSVVSDEEIAKIFSAMDPDDNGRVSIREFAAFAKGMRPSSAYRGELTYHKHDSATNAGSTKLGGALDQDNSALDDNKVEVMQLKSVPSLSDRSIIAGSEAAKRVDSAPKDLDKPHLILWHIAQKVGKDTDAGQTSGMVFHPAHINLYRLFKKVDMDMDKGITKDEWAICLRRHIGVGTDITDEDLNSIFDAIDDDENGEITIKEFCAFFRGASSSIHARGLATLKK